MQLVSAGFPKDAHVTAQPRRQAAVDGCMPAYVGMTELLFDVLYGPCLTIFVIHITLLRLGFRVEPNS